MIRFQLIRWVSFYLGLTLLILGGMHFDFYLNKLNKLRYPDPMLTFSVVAILLIVGLYSLLYNKETLIFSSVVLGIAIWSIAIYSL